MDAYKTVGICDTWSHITVSKQMRDEYLKPLNGEQMNELGII